FANYPRYEFRGLCSMVQESRARCACPLWVISGHLVLGEKESAFPLKADMLCGGEKSPLSAISRHRLPRLASWEAHELERLAMTCLAAKQSSSTQSCPVLGS